MGYTDSLRIPADSVRRPSHQDRGFSLLELVIGMAIVGLIASVAIPGYTSFVDRAKVSTAIADIKRIDMGIERYRIQNGGLAGSLPDDLGQVGFADLDDPWGNHYEYLLIEGMPPSISAKARQDRHLKPINTDYDLYSNGKDGVSNKSIVNKSSLDDIVRGKNGYWVGLGADF